VVRINVFFTGGTGFIGSHVIDELLRSGYSVKALVRKSSSLDNLKEALNSDSLELIRGDITESDSIKGTMEGMDVLIHTAAFASDWGKREDFEKVNIEGTKNILEEARNSKVPHIIHVSTNAVMGEEDCLETKSELSPYRPRFNYFLNGIFPSAMNHYRETKAEGEKTAREFCKMNEIKLTVARPVWVYGEREFHSGPYITAKAAGKGTRILPGKASTKYHCIYVKDLARYLVSLADREGNGEKIFNIVPEIVPTVDDIYGQIIRKMTGKDPIYLPRWLLYPVGFWMELFCTIFGTKDAPVLTRARVNMGYFNNVYDTSLLHETVKGLKETGTEKGIEQSIGWWKDHGCL